MLGPNPILLPSPRVYRLVLPEYYTMPTLVIIWEPGRGGGSRIRQPISRWLLRVVCYLLIYSWTYIASELQRETGSFTGDLRPKTVADSRDSVLMHRGGLPSQGSESSNGQSCSLSFV